MKKQHVFVEDAVDKVNCLLVMEKKEYPGKDRINDNILLNWFIANNRWSKKREPAPTVPWETAFLSQMGPTPAAFGKEQQKLI